MPTISQLSTVTTVAGGDLLPVYSSSDSDTRKVSLTNLKTFINEDVVATDDKVTQFSAPTATGFTVTVTNGPDSIWLVITPLAGYAAGTITLPVVANCVNKQEVLVISTQAITALTVSGNGATVVGAPTTMAANAFFRLKFEVVLSRWYRVG